MVRRAIGILDFDMRVLRVEFQQKADCIDNLTGQMGLIFHRNRQAYTDLKFLAVDAKIPGVVVQRKGILADPPNRLAFSGDQGLQKLRT